MLPTENPTNETARDCGYGVIYDIGLSPRDAKEIWIGTDDGRIQLTENDGGDWRDVTPPDLTPWSRVTGIEASTE